MTTTFEGEPFIDFGDDKPVFVALPDGCLDIEVFEEACVSRLDPGEVGRLYQLLVTCWPDLKEGQE
jgi:hypothetical protein